jgi:hypothetical protein
MLGFTVSPILNDWLIAAVMLCHASLVAWLTYDTNQKKEIKKLLQERVSRATAFLESISPYVSLILSTLIIAAFPWPLSRFSFGLVVFSVCLSFATIQLDLERRRRKAITSALARATAVFSGLHKAHVEVLRALHKKQVLSSEEVEPILSRMNSALDKFYEE